MLSPRTSTAAHHHVFLARMRGQDSSVCQGVAKPTACASTPAGEGSSRNATCASRTTPVMRGPPAEVEEARPSRKQVKNPDGR
ncbi:hypothetical protein HMI49_20640 [Corallococcus exercitus]|uniref:Uncharacterized protein n=1 Tax=Corallococcus exercitus TaxID=2316736 RepID=A0A7Y4KKY1_9BACT|nr:hypothetical protein [Corallococcus exercitus]NOK35611.1 hypothetical protein [Corallococcus exercitus]